MSIIGAVPGRTKVSEKTWNNYIKRLEECIPSKQDRINYNLMDSRIN
jgi:hypothetical protein